MPVKMVELGAWIEEWNQGAVTEGSGSRDAPGESSHLMERFLAALTDPAALAPVIENLALWTAACDHLRMCGACRSGLVALATLGDTPEGALGALLAHAAQGELAATTIPLKARNPRPRRKGSAPARAASTPGAAALASYVAIVQEQGMAAAMKQLPDVARHLRGCLRCRRDVADALAALQALAASAK